MLPIVYLLEPFIIPESKQLVVCVFVQLGFTPPSIEIESALVVSVILC